MRKKRVCFKDDEDRAPPGRRSTGRPPAAPAAPAAGDISKGDDYWMAGYDTFLQALNSDRGVRDAPTILDAMRAAELGYRYVYGSEGEEHDVLDVESSSTLRIANQLLDCVWTIFNACYDRDPSQPVPLDVRDTVRLLQYLLNHVVRQPVDHSQCS